MLVFVQSWFSEQYRDGDNRKIFRFLILLFFFFLSIDALLSFCSFFSVLTHTAVHLGAVIAKQTLYVSFLKQCMFKQISL